MSLGFCAGGGHGFLETEQPSPEATGWFFRRLCDFLQVAGLVLGPGRAGAGGTRMAGSWPPGSAQMIAPAGRQELRSSPGLWHVPGPKDGSAGVRAQGPE